MITSTFTQNSSAVLHVGDCLDLLETLPSESMQLVVTSPPYNIGKPYERRLELHEYIEQQTKIIEQSFRVLKENGSICWQVGNYVDRGEIIPLDVILYPVFHSLGLKLRNRIVWHFEHGLHCSKRFSGRYETILWFTKSDDYYFDVDPVRVPQKYPGKKHFKGSKAGQLSGNPLGKNPGDVWVIPNVKSNHIEKTEHPCQFPVELIERLVLSMSAPGDWILDPFVGSGTTVIAAVKHNRKGAGAELSAAYAKIAFDRIGAQLAGQLKTRPMNLPVFDPLKAGKSLTTNFWTNPNSENKSPRTQELFGVAA